MDKITVYDSPMGSGKTEYAIQKLLGYSNDGEKRFIYITPYLSEVDRVCKRLKEEGIRFKQPNNRNSKGSKLSSFSSLLMQGENIVTTHALFDRVDERALTFIRLNQYDLYLDEVFDVVSNFEDLTLEDFNMLLFNKKCRVLDNTRIEWLDDHYEGKFNQIKNLCNLGEMYFYSNKFFIYNFPIKVFNKMDKVNVFTFGFKGQIQYGYYKFYNKEMDFKMVYKENGAYKEKDYNKEEVIESFRKTMDLIHVYDGKMNFSKGDDRNISLSATALRRYCKEGKNSEELRLLRNMLGNYFRHHSKTSKSSDNLWTTLKSAKTYLKGNGYTKGFISSNTRATNDYINRKACAYVYDKYFNPIQWNFLRSKGIQVDQNAFALVELLQLLFRGCIRKNQPMEVFIPSSRMRNLLENWEEYL